MIKKRADYTIEMESAQGGLGNFEIAHQLVGDELPNHMKLCAVVTMKPGEECAYHKHEGDSEIYYFVAGKGEYLEEGKTTIVEAGDTTCTYDGQSHGVKNIGDTDLIFVATIPYTK